MENLFDKDEMIPRALKKMGIYGDYILEVRGDITNQLRIKNGIKYNESCAISYMKDWHKTKRGRTWWVLQKDKFLSTLAEMIINKSKSNS